jgi:hypothetical protein
MATISLGRAPGIGPSAAPWGQCPDRFGNWRTSASRHFISHYLRAVIGYPQQGHDFSFINRVSQLPAFSFLIERRRRFCLQWTQRAARTIAINTITKIKAAVLSITCEGSPVTDATLFGAKLPTAASTIKAPGIQSLQRCIAVIEMSSKGFICYTSLSHGLTDRFLPISSDMPMTGLGRQAPVGVWRLRFDMAP